LATNVAAVTARAPGSSYRARFDNLAKLFTGEANATAHDAVSWLNDLCDALEIPPLSAFGVTPTDFDQIVAKSKVASSMKGNPISLSDQELHQILSAAL
jgi:alcohol dehydrogenase class IV